MSKVYKKIIALFLCLSMVFATACGGAGKDSSDSGKSSDKNDKKEKVKVTMVTDQGGITINLSTNQHMKDLKMLKKKDGWITDISNHTKKQNMLQTWKLHWMMKAM